MVISVEQYPDEVILHEVSSSSQTQNILEHNFYNLMINTVI